MVENSQTPLFEMPPTPEVPLVDSKQIAALADANPILEYEDRTSEAARDQGHGPQEKGTPIEDEDHPRRKPEAITAQKEARAKRRRRATREGPRTDIGTDEAAILAAGKDFEARGGELAEDASDEPPLTPEEARNIIARRLAAKSILRVMDDTKGEAKLQAARLVKLSDKKE